MSSDDEETLSGTVTPTAPVYDEDTPSGVLTPVGEYNTIMNRFKRGELFIGHTVYYRGRWEQIVKEITDSLDAHMDDEECKCYEYDSDTKAVIDAVIETSKCTSIEMAHNVFGYHFASEACRVDNKCIVSAKMYLDKHDTRVDVTVLKLSYQDEDTGDKAEGEAGDKGQDGYDSPL